MSEVVQFNQELLFEALEEYLRPEGYKLISVKYRGDNRWSKQIVAEAQIYTHPAPITQEDK